MPVLSRVLGVATIATGVLEFAKPDLWAKPTGIVGPSPAMRTWHQTLGARDVLSGLAMTFAPAGPALRAATLFRIVSDATDALAFGINAPERPAQGQGGRHRARLRRGQRRSPCGGPASDGRALRRPTAAVVGSGVAGLTAAYLLQRTHDVTLFEADDRLGGHAHTHDVATPDGRVVAVDTGFIVHNERTYPNLLRLFGELGVATQPTEMSMSITCEGCGLEYAGARGLSGLFAQPRRAGDPALPADARRGQALPRARPPAARPRRRRTPGRRRRPHAGHVPRRSAATPATSSSTS